MSLSGSGGGHRATRAATRHTPTSPGVLTRGPRSPIRGAADSGSTRPSNNVFGVLAEDGKDSGDDAADSGNSFPAQSPFFSSWFSKF